MTWPLVQLGVAALQAGAVYVAWHYADRASDALDEVRRLTKRPLP